MAEIASISGQPLGTVTKQLSRAIAQFGLMVRRGEPQMNQDTDLEDSWKPWVRRCGRGRA